MSDKVIYRNKRRRTKRRVKGRTKRVIKRRKKRRTKGRRSKYCICIICKCKQCKCGMKQRRIKRRTKRRSRKLKGGADESGIYGSRAAEVYDLNDQRLDYNTRIYIPGKGFGNYLSFTQRGAFEWGTLNRNDHTIIFENGETKTIRGLGIPRERETVPPDGVEYEYGVGAILESKMNEFRIAPQEQTESTRSVQVLSERCYALKHGGVLCVSGDSVIDFGGQQDWSPATMAIVNAANCGGLGGGGVDEVITGAGGSQLAAHRRALPVLSKTSQERIETGGAVITGPGKYGDIFAAHVIHAVGPNYNVLREVDPWSLEMNDEDSREYTLIRGEADAQLTSAYKQSMALAKKARIKHIAFSLISSFVFRGPMSLDHVLQLGLDAVCEAVYPDLEEVHLVGFREDEKEKLMELLSAKIQREEAAAAEAVAVAEQEKAAMKAAMKAEAARARKKREEEERASEARVKAQAEAEVKKAEAARQAEVARQAQEIKARARAEQESQQRATAAAAAAEREKRKAAKVVAAPFVRQPDGSWVQTFQMQHKPEPEPVSAPQKAQKEVRSSDVDEEEKMREERFGQWVV